jgi:hypothetical protein
MSPTTQELIANVREKYNPSYRRKLHDAESFGRKGQKFRYKITLDVEELAIVKPVKDKLEEKKKSKRRIITLLASQIVKASHKKKTEDYRISMTIGYGAFGSREYIDSYSGMKMIPATKEHSNLYREYFATVESKTREILKWVIDLPDEKYSKLLHGFLLRMIVVKKPIMSESDRLETPGAIQRLLES